MQLTQALKRAVQINRTGTATRFEDRQWTWEQFGNRVARLAAGIRNLGVRDGDRVAILALNSDRYLEFLFAVPWAGGVFVPINTRLAPPEIVYWLNDSGASVLFVDDNFTDMLPRIRNDLESVDHLVYLGDEAAPAGMTHHESLIDGSAAADDAMAGGDTLAGIFYTGGTTGQSKGVMLSHTNLVSNALFIVPGVGFNQDTNWLHAAPMFHLADGCATIGITMVAGSHCFIPSFNPDAALAAIARYRVTNSVFVPTMVNMLVNHPRLADYDVSSLKTMLYGASPMPEAVIRQAMQVMPQVQFIQGYGQTEAAPLMTLLTARYHQPDGPHADKMTSAGLAALGIEVQILDEDGHECPRGTVGEICGRGPNVMLGYWNKPELTAETLRDGWLHTGDGGYMDADGFLYIVDRVKDMIISGGENVYSAEVENAVYQHAAVAECAVIGVPSDKWGEQVHAIVRLKDGAALDEAGLIAHCHALIAGYKCPRSVSFVTDPLPLSGAGKILKTELRKPYWEGQAKQVH